MDFRHMTVKDCFAADARFEAVEPFTEKSVASVP